MNAQNMADQNNKAFPKKDAKPGDSSEKKEVKPEKVSKEKQD